MGLEGLHDSSSRVCRFYISVLLTDLASCLFSVGQHSGLEDNMMVIVIETAEGHF